jgi:hypothetical protein
VRPKMAATVMKILRKLGENPVPIGRIVKGKGDSRVV